ncbi:hypothetical protein EE612_047730 [Oryza sativa]|nr:hypothetical protein EE612_047730 [Oryza sativa]
MVSPKISSMLSSPAVTPSGRHQEKACSRLARVSWMTLRPRLYPGHILRPEPNGNSSKSRPLTSIPLPTNRSGRNSSGESHTDGSWPMVHVLTSTRVPAGTS